MPNPFLRFAIALLLCLKGCAPKRQGADSDIASAAVAPLSITGTWIIDSYLGYSYPKPFERKHVALKAHQVKDSAWRLVTQLDTQGNGLVTSILGCEKNIKSGESHFGLPAPITFDVFPDSLRPINCVRGEKTEIEKKFRFSSIEKHMFPKNIGFQGVSENLLTLCSRLRGHRFVLVQDAGQLRTGTFACIGFADSAANQLTMFAIPQREVVAIKIGLRRFN